MSGKDWNKVQMTNNSFLPRHVKLAIERDNESFEFSSSALVIIGNFKSQITESVFLYWTSTTYMHAYYCRHD